MRRSELAHLTIYSVDPERGIVVIRQGKGKKDRVVPIGDRAIAWLQKYLDEARPQLVAEPDDGLLFLAYTGQPFSPICSRGGWLVTSTPRTSANAARVICSGTASRR